MKYVDILNEAWAQHLDPKKPDAPTVISTFAGCGGSSLGYSMAGYRELLAVEWDPNAAATFRLNFPDVPVYEGDIAKLSLQQCLDLAKIQPGDLDVLDGSPPCQGFSTAGKRNLTDSRNSLFREYVRLLNGLRPKVFVMENVSGMVKGKMRLVFAEILHELRLSGYAVAARLLNAAYFNVPQSRPRLFFIGIRSDLDLLPSFPDPHTFPLSLGQGLNNLPDLKQTQHCSLLQMRRWMQTIKGKAHKERFSLLRLRWDRPVPTILRTSGSGGHMHPDEPRLLSVGELQRCASFPDQFSFAAQSWHQVVSQIGNSVPPLFMRAIAQHIRTNILTEVFLCRLGAQDAIKEELASIH